LEEVTHKKEKRLRKYFMENEILIKYQLIHDNLIKQEHRETDFIEHQHLKIKNSINELQL
jgi:phage antirepressor YoqD-like protein